MKKWMSIDGYEENVDSLLMSKEDSRVIFFYSVGAAVHPRRVKEQVAQAAGGNVVGVSFAMAVITTWRGQKEGICDTRVDNEGGECN